MGILYLLWYQYTAKNIAMKNSLLLVILIAGLAATTKAQEKPLAPGEYRDHINKVATLCDVVYEVKIISDTVTNLYMGGNHTNAKFTIAIKGNKLQLDWANIKGKHLCVTGVLQLYKNTIQIIAAQPNQINVSK
jgi:DNA/RNA endonuclease YhcR with UshA esterase domain